LLALDRIPHMAAAIYLFIPLQIADQLATGKPA
jgi:hypothetical protein